MVSTFLNCPNGCPLQPGDGSELLSFSFCSLFSTLASNVGFSASVVATVNVDRFGLGVIVRVADAALGVEGAVSVESTQKKLINGLIYLESTEKKLMA